MTYNYLATLRLHDNDAGRALTVGPMRRVVFSHGISRIATKQSVKDALKPLEGVWSLEEGSPWQELNRITTERKLMSYRSFRNEARKLLINAGIMPMPSRKELEDVSN